MMMGLKWVFAGIVVLAVGACGRGTPAAGLDPRADDPVLLRVYTVAPEKAPEIRQALSNVLMTGKEETSHGRVSQLADGRLLILAPAGLQASIAAALKNLDAESGEHGPSPSSAVRLKCWIVDADPMLAEDDPATAPISAALEASRASLGKAHFVLHDALSVTASLDGESSTASTGRRTSFTSNLRPARDGVRAMLTISGDSGTHLTTTTTMPFDQTVVLAELSAGSEGSAPTARQHLRLYIVRAERVGKA